MDTLPPWDPSLSVGNPALDDQHEKISHIAREVIILLQNPTGHKSLELLPKLLQHLYDQCSLHFADEEALLRRNGYPDLARHAEEHRLFLENLNELIDRVEIEHLDSVGITSMMFHFWYEHMLHNDIECRDYLKP